MSDLLNRRIPLWALAFLVAAVILVVILVARQSPSTPEANVPVPTADAAPSPAPTAAATVAATASPVPTAEPTNTPVPTPEPTFTPTAVPTSTPTDTPTPSPTPEPTPTSTPTPIGGHPAAIVGRIAFATEAEEALAVLSGNPPNPPHFRPGERIFAAIQLEAATPGAIIRRVWYRNGEQVGQGESVVAEAMEPVSGNVGERWGMPGGNYELVVWDGDIFIGSATFTVDTGEVRVARVAFTREVDALGLPVAPSHNFPSETEEVLISFQAFNVPTGAIFEIERVVNGATEPVEPFAWPVDFSSGVGAFQIVVLNVTPTDRPVEPGDYRFRLKYEGNELVADIIKIEAGNGS